MVDNTSATGGYLLPSGDPPLEGKALLRFIQQVVANVTGLDGSMVRPRWQPEPPNIPTAGTAWAAVGVSTRTGDIFSYVRQSDDGLTSEVRTHEELDVLCSFYDLGAGGLADEYASRLKMGMAVAQNREVMSSIGMGLIEVGVATPVPSLLKEQWLYRVDMPFRLRRILVRTYSVQSILEADATLKSQGSSLISRIIKVITG